MLQRDDPPQATRSVSCKVIAALAPVLPELVGGSADLAGSNNTLIPDTSDVSRNAFSGRIIHFGVREHAWRHDEWHGPARRDAAVWWHLSHFFRLARPAIRMAALSGLPVTWIFTHDSIGLGEDGPTHQPIEQVASLRAMPNLKVLRPADANETGGCLAGGMAAGKGPCALVLSRQKLPILKGTDPDPAAGLGRGAYVLVDAEGSAPAGHSPGFRL